MAKGLMRVMVMMGVLAVAGPAAADHSVPFVGKAAGVITSMVPGPAGLALQVEASGQASHLGQFTRYESLVLNPTTGEITGLMHFVTASGDLLYARVEGAFVSQTRVAGTYHITSGTGRLEGVTGVAAFSLSSSDGVNFTVEFQGRLDDRTP